MNMLFWYLKVKRKDKITKGMRSEWTDRIPPVCQWTELRNLPGRMGERGVSL